MGAFLQDKVVNALQQFESHSLSDLKNASLMNRVDTKFIIPVSCLPEILESLRDHYSVLEIDGRRCFRYSSVYFDTSSLDLYNMHHSGRLNRYKVRLRSYLDSGSQFLEVKFKNNKKRTIKTRIALESGAQMAEDKDAFNIDLSDHRAFLASTGFPQHLNLKPCLTNSYQRIAFASELRGERLTIDLNLANESVFENGSQSKVQMEQLAIVELKQARVCRSSPFFKIIRSIGIRPSSFSKYCMGLTMTNANGQNFKINRFKRILNRVERLKTASI